MSKMSRQIIESSELDPIKKVALDTFLDYSSARIREQALPNFLDGLVPSQKKHILAMQDMKAFPENRTQKSVAIVAQQTKEYHPVGSTYPVLVTMSQDWKVQAMLTQPEGNWGNPESGEPAAERYTENKLSEFAKQSLLDDLPNKRVVSSKEPHGIVPCSLTYTDMYHEEDYLPAQVPNLLLNGSNGIAVGIAQTWQPLQYESLLKELIRFVKKGKINYSNLSLGYPCECPIVSPKEDFIKALKTGKGSIKQAPDYEVHRRGGEHSQKIDSIVFRTSPHGVLLNKIGDAFNTWRNSDPSCPFVASRNESSEDAIVLRFRLRPNANFCTDEDGEFLAKLLYAKVPIVASHTINMVALKNSFPIQYTLQTFFTDWVEERQKIIKRLAERALRILEEKSQRLAVSLFVKNNLDDSIQIIKATKTLTALKRGFNELRVLVKVDLGELSNKDIDIILGLNLRSLSNLSEVEIEKKYKENLKESKDQRDLVNSEETRRLLITSQIKRYVKNQEKLGVPKYKTPFRPDLGELIDSKVKISKEKSKTSFNNYLVDSTVTDIIVQTNKGYIFRVSNKALKKDTELELNMGDVDDYITQCSYLTTSYLTLITSSGKLAFIERDKIPYSSKGSIHVNQILTWAKIKKVSEVDWAVIIPKMEDSPTYLTFLLDNRFVKKVKVEDLNSTRISILLPEKPTSCGYTGEGLTYQTVKGSNKINRSMKKLSKSSARRLTRFPNLTNLGALTKVVNQYILKFTKNTIRKEEL